MLWHLLVSFILFGYYGEVHSLYEVKSKTTFPSFKSLKSRVKRDWIYPNIKISESVEGISFVSTKVATIKSSEPEVSQFELLSGSVGVDEGYFEVRNADEGGKHVGEIWQLKGIDHEEVKEMIIYARGLNSQGEQVEENDVELVIEVLDLNDNKPVFVPSSLTGSVAENTNPGYSFLTLQAEDKDGRQNKYGVVSFSYVGEENPPADNGQPQFAVNSDGQVSVLTRLDRETVNQIRFVVAGIDSVPSLSRFTTTATVTVNILDRNDHAPYFSQNEYQASIGELAGINDKVIELEANDDDEGTNKAVYFEITSGNTGNVFSIRSEPGFNDGPSIGVITVDKPLDFEDIPSYTLNVKAYNKDGDQEVDTLTALVTVRITINDENEPPVFLNTPYTGKVVENSESPMELITTVQAVDIDFGGQPVTYDIQNGKDWFEIKQNGTIFAKSPVDRESDVVDQKNSQFILYVTAKDNYPDQTHSTGSTSVVITIGDKNDNAPSKDAGWDAIICENPTAEMRKNITTLTVVDDDTSIFQPIKFDIIEEDGEELIFRLDVYSDSQSALVHTPTTYFSSAEKNLYEIPIRLSDTGVQGQPSLTSTETLTIRVCECDANNKPTCAAPKPTAAGFPVGILLAVIAALIILTIIVLALVAYRRRRDAENDKQALFYDEDDIRENLQAYHEEGGEEDNDMYDISALQAAPLIDPKRQDIVPLGNPQPQPRRMPPDTDIGDYINDAKQHADNDPTAPPFDSILVFDYEGHGSDAGSLSSLNSGTTDASQDYDYLNDWGPRFKKLADMYGGGEED